MSKELTEQWLNGTLPAGCYYVLSTEDDTPVACDIDTVCDFMIRDIIATVPDYDQFVEVTKKVEQLEEQLKEAETVIQLYFKNTQNVTYQSLGMNDCYYKKAFIHKVTKEYLEKWGVK